MIILTKKQLNKYLKEHLGIWLGLHPISNTQYDGLQIELLLDGETIGKSVLPTHTLNMLVIRPLTEDIGTTTSHSRFFKV